MFKILRRFAAPAAAVAVLQLGAGAASAAPGTPPIDDPVLAAFVSEVGIDTIANQEAILDLRDWMFEQPGFADGDGYVGAIDDLPNRATTIMWYGARTPLLAKVIAEGARRGIRVSVQPRRYSIKQLTAAVDVLWRQASAGAYGGFTISTIEALGVVENGLTVTGTYATAGPAGRAAAPATLPAAVNGIPVRVQATGQAAAQSARGTDWSPFYSGGYLTSPSGGLCSVGFAVTINGVSRMTTARHCTANDYHSRDASGTVHQYGAGVASSANGVRALSKPGLPYMFTGAWDANAVRAVSGGAVITLNSLVCTSGGNSGQHCNIKVTNSMVFWNDGAGLIWTIRGDQQIPGAITSMQGDSGGPVFTFDLDGRVRAAGMIQAGISDTLMFGNDCGSVHDYSEPFRGGVALSCSRGFLFTPLWQIVDGLGAKLQTV